MMPGPSEHDHPAVLSIDEARKIKEKRNRIKPKKQDEGGPRSKRYNVPDAPEEPNTEEPPPPPVDNWGPDGMVESGEYDPDAFYTSTSVGEEGSTRVSVNVSRSIMYLVDSIVQSGRFPDVRVSQDAFRDAIAHWLHKRSHGVPPHIEVEIQRVRRNHIYLSRVQERQRRRETVEEILELTDRELSDAHQANDEEGFMEAVADAQQHRDNLRGTARERMDEILRRAKRLQQDFN